MSPGSGAPLFIVNGFLNATQCEALVAKLASERVASVAYQQNRRGVDDPTARTSTHVRVIKAETPGLHRRVAELTGRSVANMESVRAMHTSTGTHTHRHTHARAHGDPMALETEPDPYTRRARAAKESTHAHAHTPARKACALGGISFRIAARCPTRRALSPPSRVPREQAKIIHYERSQEFTRHFDYSATAGDKRRFKALDGRAIPRHVNRELCAPPPLHVDRLGHGRLSAP